MNKDDILNVLEKKYGQKVIIDSYKYLSSKEEYEVKAHLSSNQAIKFYTRFKRENSEFVKSTFRQAMWNYQANEYISNKFSGKFDKFISKAMTNHPLESNFDFTINPSFQDLITNYKEDLTFSVICYFFSDYAQNEPFWEKFQSFIEEFQKMNLKKSHFNFSFYDPNFFENKNLEEYSYGFIRIKKGFFEYDFQDKLKAKLIFAFTNESSLPSIEQYKSALDLTPSIYSNRAVKFD